MATAGERLASEALKALDCQVCTLLLRCGTEDHDEIVWASFSDDEGATRIIMRAYRQDAARVFGLLFIAELRKALTNARTSGERKVLWGILGD